VPVPLKKTKKKKKKDKQINKNDQNWPSIYQLQT